MDMVSTCRCWPTHCLGVLFTLWLLLMSHVKTDGKLDIQFISFWSDGKEISGHCCDGDLVHWCNGKCDPKFTLCIDGPYGRVPCSLYVGTTNYIDNHNTIHFGSSIQGTANSIIIPVSKAVPSSIQITVEVYDHDDTSSGDLMDTISQLINIRAPATEQTALYTQYTVWGRTKLQIQVRAYCEPDWYGSGCEKYCKATTDQSHYTCHAHTGAKVCFEGWEGDNCDEDIDECTEINMCQHGGICTNTPGRFECICIEGIKNIVNITLLGEINHTNRGDLTDGLNRLIAELGEIPGKVDVNFTTNTQTECNYTTTYVQLYSSLENGTILDSASVNMIFESNSDAVLNEYLPLPLYPPRQEEKSTVKRPHDSWDTDQYVLAVLLPLGLVLMIVLPLMAFGILKRKSDTSQCIDDENDQINSFGMDVPRNRNTNRPGTITGSLQDASVSPDGNPCLHFHDVDEGTLDTHCDDGATGDMTLDSWSRKENCVSPDDNARNGDITPLDTYRHATSNIHHGTGDMTLDPCSLHGAIVSESVNTRLHDEGTLEARNHVAAHLPVDVLHLRQTINYEPLDRCEEEDTECTVTDDIDVENISEEDSYVDVVVLNM